MQKLAINISTDEVQIPLRRDHVLEDALRSVKRSTFPITHRVNVSIVACIIYIYIYIYILHMYIHNSGTCICNCIYICKVQFLGEVGEDGGGLRREFWALLCKDVKSSLFEGVGDRCVLRHDAVGLQVRLKLSSRA